MSINISHLEKLYIENKDYIDSLSSDEIEKLISSPLYREILGNIFYDSLKTRTISYEDYSKIVGNYKVLDIIDHYLNSKGIKIIDDEVDEVMFDSEAINELLNDSSLKYYITSMPTRILTPRQERHLFICLKSEKKKLEEINEKIFNSKQGFIYSLALKYSEEASITAIIKKLKGRLFELLARYEEKEDLNTFIEKNLKTYSRNTFTADYITRNRKKNKDIEVENKVKLLVDKDNIEELNELKQDLIEQNKVYSEIVKKIGIYNLRLVLWTVKRLGLFNSNVNNLEDIIQDGNAGLLRAIKAFDIDKNNKFSLYAFYWIKKSIIENSSDSELISMPRRDRYLLAKINKYIEEFKVEKGMTPSVEEIAERFGSTKNTVKSLLQFSNDMISLDNTIESEEDDERELLDTIVDENQNVENSYLMSVLQKGIYEELKKVNYKERLTIMLRLGIRVQKPEVINAKKGSKIVINSNNYSKDELIDVLNDLGIRYIDIEDDILNDGYFHQVNPNTSYIYLDGEERTLRDVAEIFGVSHQRVSKIEKDGYGSLKTLDFRRKFKDFYE